MPAAKSPKIRAKAIELAKNGHSARQIEALLARLGMGMGKSAVAELVKLYRTDPGRAGGEAGPADLPSPPSVETEADGSIPDLDLEELRTLSALFAEKLREAVAQKDVKLTKGLLDARLVTAREIARLRPPTPPDPTKDPANAAAREELRARLERLRAASLRPGPALEQVRAYLEANAAAPQNT